MMTWCISWCWKLWSGHAVLGGMRSPAAITSSTTTSWVTQAATKRHRCSLASACLHPSNLSLEYAGTHNCRHIKKLTRYNRPHASTVSRADFKLLSWSCLKICVGCLFHPTVCFTCCCHNKPALFSLKWSKWIRNIGSFLTLWLYYGKYVLAVAFEHDFRPVTQCLRWWPCAAAAVVVRQLAEIEGGILFVWLTPGWPILLPSLSHPGTTERRATLVSCQGFCWASGPPTRSHVVPSVPPCIVPSPAQHNTALPDETQSRAGGTTGPSKPDTLLIWWNPASAEE